MSSKQLVTQGIILALLFMFPGIFYSLKFLSTQANSYDYNAPSYYSQYNYNYGYGYGYNSINSIYSRYPPVAYNAYRGRGPYLMPSNSYNPLYGYRPNYDSHIYIDSALDYTYYSNPQLLEPRYMNNHQWYARGLWPQGFYY